MRGAAATGATLVPAPYLWPRPKQRGAQHPPALIPSPTLCSTGAVSCEGHSGPALASNSAWACRMSALGDSGGWGGVEV